MRDSFLGPVLESEESTSPARAGKGSNSGLERLQKDTMAGLTPKNSPRNSTRSKVTNRKAPKSTVKQSKTNRIKQEQERLTETISYALWDSVSES